MRSGPVSERQGYKSVLPPDGLPVEVTMGELPEPGSELLALWGEPTFAVRLPHALVTREDLPGELVAVLAPLASRLSMVTPAGAEGGEMHVEDVVSSIEDGALVLVCDTDGMGYTPEMIDTMASILVEELEPLGLPMTVSVPVVRRS